MLRLRSRSARRVRTAVGAVVVGSMVHGALGADPIIGPQVRIDVGGGTEHSSETTIASTNLRPMEIVAAWMDFRPAEYGDIHIGVGVSNDGGKTWEDFLVHPPKEYQGSIEADPITAYDNRTGTLWVGGFAASTAGIFIARKNMGENTFQEPVMTGSGWPDKPWLAAGAAPNDPDNTHLYLAYSFSFQVSTDMGQTWSSPRALPASGIGFLPRVGPNGELYIAYWNFGGGGDGVMLWRSFDGGQTSTTIEIARRMDIWGIEDNSRFPGRFRVPSNSYLAVDPNDGTLYAVYFDTTEIIDGNYNVDVYFTKSFDRGDTWTTPIVINGDADPPGDQFFTWIEVDNHGRLHVQYFDSRNVVQDDNVFNGMLDVYYSYSDDQGETWNEYRLTPNSFNSANDGLDWIDFLGDYSGLAVAGNRVYPCYLSTQNGDPDIFTNVVVFRARGDLDDDGDVDPHDFEIYLECVGGPNVPPATPDCRLADLDDDNDVDFADFDVLQLEFTGPL